MDITTVDKNFAVPTKIDIEGLKFYNIDNEPFSLHGIFKENGKYRRLPEEVAKSVSTGVHYLHANTAGGRVKFTTDSRYVAIFARLGRFDRFPHFSLTGSLGFDMYVGTDYAATFMPPVNLKDEYEGYIDFGTSQKRDVTINFPLYCEVNELYIGIIEGSLLEKGAEYKNKKPVVFYGSSITQGACASRAGMSYENILSRKFNLDYVNLGFSGSAKAEDAMIDYVKKLDMSVFVYDYDYNAPSTEHLKNTHKKMFDAVREIHPDIPIIIMNRPKFRLNAEETVRYEIIRETFEAAVNSGDKNVYFVDNKKLCTLCRDEGTIENCHPNDFGFYSMAMAVSEVFENLEIK